ncbi:hypothetical protein [Acetobacter lovaniensis]|uniref:Uncharacterized protein n=1 Tax=Acetobacter lovaniensis TaxID=104100 RepID=A0A841QFV6_9PROT|nr:hypothetical protein [Acetobacter lovaniensis]MBB6456937.1 hypothetical protein [Acetobacter lovaniensis]NHN81070.1 hypothetical protein [Acetobacter lovaniensis]GBQ69757.1 hypothetical protein AA0474_2009 [Acetobacter lovaniensis NRIC 0474]
MRTREEQIEKIIEVMKDYTLLHTYGDDGHGYPLVDALTPDGKTIDVGQAECGELAAELYDSVIAPYILEAEHRAEQRARAEIGRDSERLDWLESGCCDVRFRSEPIADTGDADVYCDIIQHHMAKPYERTIGSAETIRSAIDAAREVG